MSLRFKSNLLSSIYLKSKKRSQSLPSLLRPRRRQPYKKKLLLRNRQKKIFKMKIKQLISTSLIMLRKRRLVQRIITMMKIYLYGAIMEVLKKSLLVGLKAEAII